MRELYIPKELGVRLYFDGEQPKSSSSESGFEQALATIEKNRSELITAVVLLEDRMIEAVGTLLFRTHTSGDLGREFFTHAGVEADLRHAVERAQAAASSATAEADNQRGRSAALEEQLARLQSLPAEVEAALRRNQQAQKSPKKASKRAKKATAKAP